MSRQQSQQKSAKIQQQQKNTPKNKKVKVRMENECSGKFANKKTTMGGVKLARNL